MEDMRGATLGDILAEALQKDERVVTVTRMVEQKRAFRIPSWMFRAMEGKKIEAIRALRDDAGRDPYGNLLSLRQAKQMVDDFCI